VGLDAIASARRWSGGGWEAKTALSRFLFEAGRYNDQPATVLFHELENSFQGFCAEPHVGWHNQAVGLVYKQSATERALQYLSGFDRGLPDVSRHQWTSVDLDYPIAGKIPGLLEGPPL